jgi:hypothetical protein
MVPFYSRRTDIYDEFYNVDQLSKPFVLIESLSNSLKVYKLITLLMLIAHKIYLVNTGLLNDKLDRNLNGQRFLTPIHHICAAQNFYVNGNLQNNVWYVLRMRQSSVSSISSPTKIKLMRYVP